MSNKSKLERAKREARQEKQAKTVMLWLTAAVVMVTLLAMVYVAYS